MGVQEKARLSSACATAMVFEIYTEIYFQKE